MVRDSVCCISPTWVIVELYKHIFQSMESYIAESVEYLTTLVFYGLYFGMFVALVKPLYDIFKRF